MVFEMNKPNQIKFKMKKSILLLLVSVLFFNNCVSIKTANPIESYRLINPKSNAKSEVEGLTKYVFENSKEAIDFKLYLEDIYRERSSFDSRNFWITENDVEMNVQVLINSETSKHVDLLSPFLFKDRDEALVKEGQKRNYVGIMITDKNGKDCLANDSFYKYIALDYLESIRKEYNSY